MAGHDCRFEGDIKVLMERSGEHHSSLYGNGKDGLSTKVDRLETWRATVEAAQTKRELDERDARQRMQKNWDQVRVGIVLLLVSTIVSWLLKFI